jgi:hypothetical protein
VSSNAVIDWHGTIVERLRPSVNLKNLYLSWQKKTERDGTTTRRKDHTNSTERTKPACRNSTSPVHLRQMSAIELAVEKVKKMSARQAQELLVWLDDRQANGKSPTRLRRNSRQSALASRKQKFKKWHDSIRGTTDWEPPRMPDDLVKPYRL